MADFYDQLDVRYSSDVPRKAYRVSIPGLKVIIKGRDDDYQAMDISAGGVAFSFSEKDKPGLATGREIELSLKIKNRVFLENLRAVVIKSRDDFAACEFRDIPFRQEVLLDKLVLEVQKRMIEINRKTNIQGIDEKQ